MLRLFNFCSFFDDIGKRLDEKTKDNFKFYDLINLKTNCNSYVVKYAKK